MTHDEYCMQICKAKCCYLHRGKAKVKCPRLNGSQCSVYAERFKKGSEPKAIVGLVRIGKDWRPFVCGKIEDLLANGELPEEVKKGCCYAHPEFLKEGVCLENQKLETSIG